MPNLIVARDALEEMNAIVQLQEDRRAQGRYERYTNGYQQALESAYSQWVKGLIKKLDGSGDELQIINEALPDLIQSLEAVGGEWLVYSGDALKDFTPSPEYLRTIADSIEQNRTDIERILVPIIAEKLKGAIVEGLDLQATADSLLPKVAYQAGAMWTLIQRGALDYAAQAASQAETLYPVRWVLDPNAKHCDACVEFAKTYDNYMEMLNQTGQAIPGFFANYSGRACWLNCRCHLEIKINGVWQRV